MTYDGMSAEAYTRKHWADPAVWGDGYIQPQGICHQGFKSWQAAAEYTQQRLEEIRQVEEEIEELELSEMRAYANAEWKRILARETKVLEELHRGMKQQ